MATKTTTAKKKKTAGKAADTALRFGELFVSLASVEQRLLAIADAIGLNEMQKRNLADCVGEIETELFNCQLQAAWAQARNAK